MKERLYLFSYESTYKIDILSNVWQNFCVISFAVYSRNTASQCQDVLYFFNL
jgi:hypothetical protein